MFFKSLQKQRNIHDSGNVLQQKWDMKDIMSEVPTEDLKKLIRFFIDVDEEKTISRFFQKYDSYYDTMKETIAERKRSRAAIKRTLESIREQ